MKKSLVLILIAILAYSCDCGCSKPVELSKYPGWRVVEKPSFNVVRLVKGDSTEDVKTFEYWYRKYELGAVIPENADEIQDTLKTE